MKFSLVVPVYDVAPYLRECLGSILAQDCGDWEAICVDDGSTDGSGAVLAEMAAGDARLRVFRMDGNGGVAGARNFALGQAKGDYLWFVDGDDAIAPRALRTLSKAIDEFGSPDIVQFAHERFCGAPPRFPDAGSRPERFDLGNPEGRRRAFDLHATWLVGSNAAYSRRSFGGERFAAFANGEDSLWGRRAFYKARSLVYLDEPLYGYRVREGSASHVWTRARWADFCRVNWIMAKEGMKERGLRARALTFGLRSVWAAVGYRRQIVERD